MPLANIYAVSNNAFLISASFLTADIIIYESQQTFPWMMHILVTLVT